MEIDTLKIPNHIAIIMDGNGRWAKSKILPISAGHKRGANAAKKIIKAVKKLGTKYLTLFAFSSENWMRPKPEVDYLMDLLRNYLKNEVEELKKESINIRVIGDKKLLDSDIVDLIDNLETAKDKHDFTLILALSYGGRDEIRNAACLMAEHCVKNNINANNIRKEDFDNYLYTKDIPDPDLFIRSGGELRISNYLLWQLAYTELYFTKTLWPNFTEKVLMDAVKEYSIRNRRYGKR